LIVIRQSRATAREISKPVKCPNCTRGKIGSIPKGSEAVVLRRGKPPPDESGEGIEVKCPVCGELWILTIE
jgi:predicted RNA-binding Zn-ribbon protein involved in translation (DUF1610 family)